MEVGEGGSVVDGCSVVVISPAIIRLDSGLSYTESEKKLRIENIFFFGKQIVNITCCISITQFYCWLCTLCAFLNNIGLMFIPFCTFM